MEGNIKTNQSFGSPGMGMLRRVLTVVAVVVIVWYLATHGHEFRVLLQYDWRWLALQVPVVLLTLVVNGYTLALLLRRFRIVLPPGEWFWLTVAHSFVNYLPLPQAGAVARGVYLKRRYGLDYIRFTASLTVTYLGFLWVAGVVGLAGLSLRQGFGGQPAAQGLLWCAFALFLVGVIPLLTVTWRLPGLNRLVRFRQALEQLLTLRTVVIFMACQGLLLLLTGLGIWLAFWGLAPGSSQGTPWELPLLDAVLMGLAAIASSIAKITPGNIGVAEGSVGLAAWLLHHDIDRAIVTFTLFRMVGMVVLFALAPFAIAGLGRKLRA